MPDINLDKAVSGPYMFVHEVTGTYLETDNYGDAVEICVQTWNLDPTQKDKGWLGHLWYVESTSTPGIARIKSYENGRCLTAGSDAKDYPRLKEPNDSRLQEWIIRRVHGSDTVAHDADSYALIPRAYDTHALAIRSNYVGNDAYVVPMSMWGGPPSLSQYWKAVHQGDVKAGGGA
ncbi:hypothetical protein [Streptomyces lasiicapitis]|uniref:Ricin B lectin domain-containing protein n=1 Tax=Streptomyces lasiicapitis TaxID=1923961 RepID=A0ABQ2MJI6_9ACTN|nr:hypothetical protein [Streptomyces lasiicapitis]GGO52915.1 hypothetical protein GCM10012286_59050 [Streptomyces lasiicapitis]